jgi:hypothetical protein
MMAALVAGERSPKVLARMARHSMRKKITVLEEAFTGYFTDHHAFLLQRMLDRVDAIRADIAALEARIESQMAPFAAAVEKLDEIPGISLAVAHVILAEIGLDMTRFPHGRAPGVLGQAGTRREGIRGEEERQGLHRPRQHLPGPRPGQRGGGRREDRRTTEYPFGAIAGGTGTKTESALIGGLARQPLETEIESHRGGSLLAGGGESGRGGDSCYGRRCYATVVS